MPVTLTACCSNDQPIHTVTALFSCRQRVQGNGSVVKDLAKIRGKEARAHNFSETVLLQRRMGVDESLHRCLSKAGGVEVIFSLVSNAYAQCQA